MNAMVKLGHKITVPELEEIMKKHDTSKDNKLCVEEFRAIFMDID